MQSSNDARFTSETLSLPQDLLERNKNYCMVVSGYGAGPGVQSEALKRFLKGFKASL
jgi:hypothetical protein